MTSAWDGRSPREQRRIRRLVLAEWVPAVAAYSPYWASRIAAAVPDPRDVDSLKALRRLPPVRERDVAGAGGPGAPALVLRPTGEQVKGAAPGGMLWRLAAAIRSGGADAVAEILLREFKPIHLHRAGRTGDLLVAYSRSDLDRLHRTGARAARVLGLTPGDNLVSALPPGPCLPFWGVYHLGLGSSMLAAHPRSTGGGLGAAASGFRLLPATAVAVTPEEAEDLAGLVARAGGDLRYLHTVVVVGPPPAPDRRGAIAHAWEAAGAPSGVRVRAAWAPSEGRALWAECAEGGSDAGLHTYPDLEVLEVLDAATGSPVEGGGDLTLTSAGWNGTALLRYRTGDWVEALATGPCPACGRTVPRLTGEVVPGAWQSSLRGARGAVPVDLRGVPAALSGVPDLVAWHLELRPAPSAPDSEDELLVELTGTVEDPHDLADRIAEAAGLRPRLAVLADEVPITRRVEELGSPFADLR